VNQSRNYATGKSFEFNEPESQKLRHADKSPEKRAPARRFSRSIAGLTLGFIVGQAAATAIVHRRRPTARRIVSPFPLQNRPAVSSVPIATSSARFSTRRFTICGTKRIYDFGIRPQFMELRRGQDARGPGVRSKVA
jgi:hypothetical protein